MSRSSRTGVGVRALALALALATLTACGSGPRAKVWRADDFVVRSGELHQVAVLPFRVETPGHGVLWLLGRPFVWLGRLATFNFSNSQPDPQETATMLRTLLVARLQGEAIAVVSQSMVDASLAALPPEVDRDDPVALAQHLGVDGILDGSLTAVGASYHVLSTSRELAGKVRLRCGWDGKQLFTADVRVDDSAGIDHGPTGLLSLVAVPLAAIDSGPYTGMAIAWSERVARELLGSPTSDVADQRPVIDEVRVVAPERPLQAGDAIEVTALGTGGRPAHFDLGTLHREIPMMPSPTGDGTYRGVYTVRHGDRVQDAPVIVRLGETGNRAERRSTRRIDIGDQGTR